MLSESLGANVPLKQLIQKILDRQYVIVDKETVIIVDNVSIFMLHCFYKWIEALFLFSVKYIVCNSTSKSTHHTLLQ